MGDDDTQLPIGVAHMVKLSDFSDNTPASLQKLMRKDTSVGQYINEVVEKLRQHGNGE